MKEAKAKKAVDEVRREYFMSLAPVYLITSNYLMQAALKETTAGLWLRLPSITAYILSGLAMASAIWLAIAAFARLPQQVIDYTYKIFASLGIVTILVFVLGWLGTLNEVLGLKASAAYIYTYFFLGLLLYCSIVAFNVCSAFNRAQRSKR